MFMLSRHDKVKQFLWDFEKFRIDFVTKKKVPKTTINKLKSYETIIKAAKDDEYLGRVFLLMGEIAELTEKLAEYVDRGDMDEAGKVSKEIGRKFDAISDEYIAIQRYMNGSDN